MCDGGGELHQAFASSAAGTRSWRVDGREQSYKTEAPVIQMGLLGVRGGSQNYLVV